MPLYTAKEKKLNFFWSRRKGQNQIFTASLPKKDPIVSEGRSADWFSQVTLFLLSNKTGCEYENTDFCEYSGRWFNTEYYMYPVYLHNIQ